MEPITAIRIALVRKTGILPLIMTQITSPRPFQETGLFLDDGPELTRGLG